MRVAGGVAIADRGPHRVAAVEHRLTLAGAQGGTILVMKILTAKVIDGRLDVPEGSFQEGATVTLLVPESEEGFRLSQEDQALLLQSISQAERGEVVDGWELLDELPD